TEPLLEPVMPYESTRSIAEVLKEVGRERLVADELGKMLFAADGDFRLREHQARSLEVALGDSAPWNPVVTSGTGSGKTESFLLPVFARLLGEREQEKWEEPSPV